MKKRKSILTIAATLILSLILLAGCGSTAGNTTNENGTELASGGVILLKVNPEISVSYDENGFVTKVEGRNDDGTQILKDYSGYENKECREVVKELVAAIGEAGYFVEEIEGEKRQITIEIESGSRIPSDTFLDDMVADVKTCINSNKWQAPIDVKNESDYGITDYVDTDYGTGNDGVTDYNDSQYDSSTNYDDSSDYAATTKKPATTTAKKNTTTKASDYNDSKYDNNSNYDDNDASNYDDNSDYGTTAKKPATTTSKKPTTTTAKKPATTTSKKPVTTPAASDYNDSSYDNNSNYDDNSSNYDDNDSNYDDNNSNYDDNDSRYDD